MERSSNANWRRLCSNRRKDCVFPRGNVSNFMLSPKLDSVFTCVKCGLRIESYTARASEFAVRYGIIHNNCTVYHGVFHYTAWFQNTSKNCGKLKLPKFPQQLFSRSCILDIQIARNTICHATAARRMEPTWLMAIINPELNVIES